MSDIDLFLEAYLVFRKIFNLADKFSRQDDSGVVMEGYLEDTIAILDVQCKQASCKRL